MKKVGLAAIMVLLAAMPILAMGATKSKAPVLIVRNSSTLFSIYAQNNPTTQFAAKELQKYVKSITGTDIPIVQELIKGKPYIILGTSEFAPVAALRKTMQLEFDGFSIFDHEGNLYFTSNYPRGVLFAVYDFLEMQGCIFVRAAQTNEFIPKRNHILYSGATTHSPTLEFRTLCEAPFDPNEAWASEFINIIDNAAKNKINSIFIHAGLGLGFAGPLKFVSAEIEKRGLNCEMGGHGLHLFVRREWLPDKPELFRMKNGRRTETGNICPSSKEAIDILTKGVEDYFAHNQQVDILHVWFEDGQGGSWCECPLCKGITPVRQQYNVLKNISARIKERYPEKSIDMLLYHDTSEGINLLEKNEHGIYGFLAPRERCYAHSIDDNNCLTNRFYLQAIKDTVSIFGKDYSYAFEYYGDMVLYVKCQTNFARTIAKDINAYKNNGIRKIAVLSFGQYSTWAYALNLYVFAKHAWDGTLDVGKTIKQFSDGMGFEDNGFVDYLSLIEQASSDTFAFCGYARQYGDIHELQLVPLGYYGEHINKIDHSLLLLGEARRQLDALIAKSNPKTAAFLRYEDILLKITQLETEAIHARMYSRYMNNISPGKLTYQQLQAYGQKVIDNEKLMMDMISKVPVEVKGQISLKTFPDLLCRGQINVMSHIMETEFKKSVDSTLKK
jgi:hypothetical protein